MALANRNRATVVSIPSESIKLLEKVTEELKGSQIPDYVLKYGTPSMPFGMRRFKIDDLHSTAGIS